MSEKTEKAPTKIVIGGVYYREELGKKFWAIAQNVCEDKSGRFCDLQKTGATPERHAEGSDKMNGWTLVHDPLAVPVVEKVVEPVPVAADPGGAAAAEKLAASVVKPEAVKKKAPAKKAKAEKAEKVGQSDGDPLSDL